VSPVRGGRLILALDTATTQAVVALGRLGPDGPDDTPIGDRWLAGYRHGEELLGRVDALLQRAGVGLGDLAAVAIGTGPGAFTGLRVGLATAKGLAHALDVPILGLPTSSALLLAARTSGLTDPMALLLPAGPTDRVLVVTDEAGLPSAPRRIRPDEDLQLSSRTTVVAVDLDGRDDEAATVAGAAAQAGLGRALLALATERLAIGPGDDLATLVPEYVTLPRGVTREVGAVSLARG
jgi:tRNA threonylcarbamoyl adenosine modification protein YeaZ